MRQIVRKLRADEAGCFDELREWLDDDRPEMSEIHRRRLRAFFQGHPVADLRVSEEVEDYYAGRTADREG